MNPLKYIDFKSKKTQLILAFVIPGILFFILSPGTFFEIDNKEVKRQNVISYSTSGIHAVIFSIILFCFYYFYLFKNIQDKQS